MLDGVFGNFTIYFEGTMDFVISVLPHSINLSVTSIIENKSFSNPIIIRWLATPFVKLTISISEP